MTPDIQDQMSQQWTELCKVMSKPLVALNDLNTKTFSDVSHNAVHVEDLLTAKKVEDILSAQMKFMTEANSALLNYTQKVFGIMLDASSDFNHHFGRFMGDFNRVSEEVTRTAVKTGTGTGKNDR